MFSFEMGIGNFANCRKVTLHTFPFNYLMLQRKKIDAEEKKEDEKD